MMPPGMGFRIRWFLHGGQRLDRGAEIGVEYAAKGGGTNGGFSATAWGAAALV